MKNEVIEKDTNLQNKLDLIKRTVARGATNDEFQMFMHRANIYKLDPILKEIWFIKYDDKSASLDSWRCCWSKQSVANRI